MVLEAPPQEDDRSPAQTGGQSTMPRVVIVRRPPWPGPAAFGSPRRPLRRRLLGVTGWMLPALLTAALAMWHLDRPALWADELATWGAARLSRADLIAMLDTVDAVIGPYYAVMHVWVSVAGDSTAALRAPSVVAVTAATVVVTALGRRAGGPLVGVLSGLLFAALPAVSRYGQEARVYGLVMFAAALATLLLIRLLERPSPGRVAGYAGGVALLGALHPLGALLTVVAHAAAVGWGGRGHGRRTVLRWLAGVLPGLLPVAVLAAVAADQRTQVAWIRLVGWRELVETPGSLFASAAVGGVLLVLAVVGGGSRHPARVCLTATAFAPTVLLFAVGLFEPVWVTRYLVVTVPAVVVLAAAASARVGARRAVVLVVLIAAMAVPGHLEIREPDGHGQASHRVAEVIGTAYLPGDVLVFPDSDRSIPWAPRDIVARYLPAAVRPPDVLLTAPPRTGGRLSATECPDAACLGAPPRIWLVRIHDRGDPFADLSPGKRAAIERDYAVRQRWTYRLLVVLLLQRRT